MRNYENQRLSAEDILSGTPGWVHLMGVGGVGVAGVAHLLARGGWQVDGCEAAPNERTERLSTVGVPVHHGHHPAHIERLVRARAAGHSACLIRSTAIPESHPEVVAARAAGLPVLQRGVLLAAWVAAHARAIAVCGAHGKTTTTLFTTRLLREAGVAVEWCIGGEATALGEVAGRSGAEENAWLVVEADESDGTLALYRPQITVVTNIDVDHLEHFGGLEDLIACYQQVVDATRGGVAWCADNRIAAEVCAGKQGIAFGFHPDARLRATDVVCAASGSTFTVCEASRPLGRITIGVPGRHNVLNALAALAAATLAGVPLATALAHLPTACTELPQRRFETVAQVGGCRVIVDYAHHPQEIRALMSMAREARMGPLTAIFQPHRYTRTLAMCDDFPSAFEGADQVILLPVYAASEAPLVGGTSADLYAAFRRLRPDLRVILTTSLDEAWHAAAAGLADNKLLLLVGAGDVVVLAERARAAAVAETPAPSVPRARSRVPLGRLTTLGVGGVADWLADVADETELAALLADTAQRGLPVHLLGAGANTWVADGGVAGVVVRLAAPAFQRFVRIDSCEVEVGCGLSGHTLLDRLEEAELSGLEFLEGVPGTVGGWLAMNAGAHGGMISDQVVSIRCLNSDGTPSILPATCCGFSYRACAGLQSRVALAVRLTLTAGRREDIARRRATCRGQRIPLTGLRTAGSVFRNPDGDFAGRLLEMAGCKTMRVGGAFVAAAHANVIVVERGARASDVLALMEWMRRAVEHQSGVRLVPEIRIMR